MRERLIGMGLLAAASGVGCKVDPAVAAHAADVRAWREQRLARLSSEDGWLTLAGLVWLEPGERTVGSDPASDVFLPKSAPARLGVIRFNGMGSAPVLECAPGVSVTLNGSTVTRATLGTDGGSVVKYGPVSLQVIERNARLAVRIKDAESKVRAAFSGIDYWEIDPSWRVEARFEPYDPPRDVAVPNALGWTDTEKSPGVAVFELQGKELRLEPLAEDDELFFIFADATNGKESYGAGRFLYTEKPRDGRVLIDFNRAYNPPCAFTPYATCPLPPKQNVLPLAVRAGEKRYGAH